MDDEPPHATQASSHFPLEPVSGFTLFTTESSRRHKNAKLGNCLSGCAEVDEKALLGGFERGCVVGISAEEEEIGLVLGLQVIAKHLVDGLRDQDEGKIGGRRTARIVTSMGMGILVSMLKGVLRAQLADGKGVVGLKEEEMGEVMKSCLGSIAISSVFDFLGLWEVVREIGHGIEPEEGNNRADTGKEVLDNVPDVDQEGQAASVEIADSEDEDEPSPAASPAQNITEHAEVTKHTWNQADDEIRTESSSTPDIILITHTSILLSTLFHQRSSDSAHEMIQLLSAHLRYLTRSPDHNSPLILMLNSTASATPSTTKSESKGPDVKRDNNKSIDPTLCSIFNPPPLPDSRYSHHTSRAASLTRRNKPSFGLIFSQTLDVHLLCTKTPCTTADADALYAPAQGDVSRDSGVVFGTKADAGGRSEARKRVEDVEFAWVVEVLLDEIGVVEGEGGDDTRRRPRRNREQRWGAVKIQRSSGTRKVGRRIEKEIKIVDALEPVVKKHKEISLAAGFGGPRV